MIMNIAHRDDVILALSINKYQQDRKQNQCNDIQTYQPYVTDILS